MDALGQDLRYAIRTLLRRPGFAVVAVLTIAIGIGANTAIFSVVNAVLLAPLPIEEPDEVVGIDVISIQGFSISNSIPNLRDWRARSRSFSGMGMAAGTNYTLTGADRPELVRGQMILGDYFETLGVPAARGRLIAAAETERGAERNAVVTHAFWQGRFGADSDPIGRSIALDGNPFTVIGVLPEGFQFPSAETEVYVPMGVSDGLPWEIRSSSFGARAFARLAPGVPLAAAQADLDAVVATIKEEEGPDVASPVLRPVRELFVGDTRAQIWIMMGAVGFVLLIACANVASLLLARGERRRRELAVRTALGAGRRRVARQLLTESLVLALVGGAAGIGLAMVGIRLLEPALAENLPSFMLGGVGLDGTVLVFAALVTLLVGLLFGAAPALRAAAAGVVSDLREGDRGGTTGRARQRFRSGLVVAEVALSLMLLIGAGLMIRSLGNLRTVDKGFDSESVLTGRTFLSSARYPDKEATWDFYRRLHERLNALPGVRLATLSQIVPLQGNSWENRVWPEGEPTEPETGRSVLYQFVTPEHFEALGIPVLSGRTFDQGDREGSVPVTVIDETMAELFWPGEDAIGKRITFETAPPAEDGSTERIYREVIGVVKNVRHYELENPSRIQLYVPFEQSLNGWTRSLFLMVKTSGDPFEMTELVRRELAALDPEVPLAAVQTLDGYVDGAMVGSRVLSGLLGVFALVALLLSGIGLFGVISFAVARRVREIGIRMALGAEARDVLMMVTRQGMGITLVGVLVGLVGALALSRVLQSVLFGVPPIEPVTYMVVTAFLLLVAWTAAFLPARRATRVDPAVVLRED